MSLMIHSLAILLSFGSGGGNSDKADQNGSQQGSNDTGEIIPKIIEVELVETQPPTEGDLILKKMLEQKKIEEGLTKCVDDSWFGGIGIIWDIMRGGVVENVYPGYPAANAGIQRGDIIADGEQIRGKPGTPVKLTVYRPTTGETFHMTLIRDRICIRGKK